VGPCSGGVDDERFARNTERVEHNDELTPILEAAFATTTADRAVEVLDEAGTACARMRTPAEFYDHPQLAARDRWREDDSPGGPIRALVPPVSVGGRAPLMRDVPALGRDDAGIREEFLRPLVATKGPETLGGRR
jgi:itaconate CoA-transferase